MKFPYLSMSPYIHSLIFEKMDNASLNIYHDMCEEEDDDYSDIHKIFARRLVVHANKKLKNNPIDIYITPNDECHIQIGAKLQDVMYCPYSTFKRYLCDREVEYRIIVDSFHMPNITEMVPVDQFHGTIGVIAPVTCPEELCVIEDYIETYQPYHLIFTQEISPEILRNPIIQKVKTIRIQHPVRPTRGLVLSYTGIFLILDCTFFSADLACEILSVTPTPERPLGIIAFSMSQRSFNQLKLFFSITVVSAPIDGLVSIEMDFGNDNTWVCFFEQGEGDMVYWWHHKRFLRRQAPFDDIQAWRDHIFGEH